MTTTIAIVLFLAAIALFFLRKMNEMNEIKNKQIEDYNTHASYKKDFIPIIPLPNINSKILGGLAILFLVFGISNPIGYNSYGYRTVVENPISGSTWTQFDQGWYIKGPFSKEFVYPNVITNMYSDEEIEEEITSFNTPFEIRFNDATKSTASATVRWRLPGAEDSESMLKIHSEYHSPGKLASTTLNKYTRECLKYAAQLMESETHYSGGMSKLSEDFQDQLENGQYVIEYKTEYVEDATTNESRKLTTTYIRKDENNVPIRNKSDVQQFNIQVAYASVDQVDYEEQVDLKLAEKIAASTKESVSKQTLMTAQQEALTAAEQGKKLLAETTAREEAAKLEAVIRAQKQTAVDEEKAKQAIFKGRATLALKKAEAEGDKLKVLAGLSPREKAEFDKETAIGVAKALAGPNGIVFPQIVSGANGSGGGALQTVELKMLTDLARDLAKNKN